jgi:6-phosphogluconolactonase (cycloisomerase 2 family)
MLNRRELAGMLTMLPMAPAWAQGRTLPFYDSIGPELFARALDISTAALAPRGSVLLPANVQYAWPHPARPLLYVASSDGVPGGANGPGAPGNKHAVTAFRVGGDGALAPLGKALPLTARPIHLTVSGDGRFLLVAYNNPSHVTVHAIGADWLPDPALAQPPGLDFGIYVHQVRVTPDGHGVTVVTRGNDAAAGKPEDPGAIKLFGFQDGHLANRASIAPGNGLGFGPRHLDFHPRLRCAYVSLERQNSLFVYGMTPDGGFSRDPLFRQSTLADPNGKTRHPGQGAGPIHVHPGGRFVYLANRGSGMAQGVSNGGENSIAVFALDPQSGAPTHIQSIDAHGFETRTFSIDSSGTLLVAASQIPMQVAEGGLHRVSAGLSFYRIGADGKLTFLRKQDVDTAKGTHFWCGFLSMS